MVMMIPVAILAVLAVVGGFIQTRALGIGPAAVSDFLEKVVTRPNSEETGAAVVVGLATMLLAALLFWAAYRMKPWSAVVPWAQRLLERKYYFDEIYDAAFVRTMDAIASIGYRDVEKAVIDGAVVGTGEPPRPPRAACADATAIAPCARLVAGALIAAVLLLVRAS
jgi:NADH-quinone oxidoreductase subunit L